jgi:hypothetical protein
MRVAIMQPYFLPYAGYYQLIASVDQFIIYDNIKYTKKGWINRNRFLQNGNDAIFTIPLKNDKDLLNICEREISDDFDKEKLLRSFVGAYRKAVYFEQTIHLLSQIVHYEEKNLFNFIHHSIEETCRYLGITTKIIVSSSIEIDHKLQAQEKVLAMCTALGAKEYINAIGGVDLYSRDCFQGEGIQLRFIKSRMPDYAQFGGDFVPSLSIIDMMMFNSIRALSNSLKICYELI